MNLMLKIKKPIILIIIIFCWETAVFANFEITEIMYDLNGTDAGREWIEVKNIGQESLDLSEWFFFSDNTKHLIKPMNSTIVNPGEYAVIAQNEINFKNDWPNYSGLIFDSSWTDFTNKGENIALKNSNLDIISPVSFLSSMGGKGNGGSLQKVAGIWQESKPTPGSENKIIKIVSVSTESKPLVNSQFLEEKDIENEEIVSLEDERIINLNNVASESKNFRMDINNPVYAWIGLGIVIILGSGAVILIKRRYMGNYLERGLRAEDIKIVE